VSPGFEQSRAISNPSTLDLTLHCGEQRIVLPGDASWKRLCSSSVPPDDDDDDVETAIGDIHQPFSQQFTSSSHIWIIDIMYFLIVNLIFEHKNMHVQLQTFDYVGVHSEGNVGLQNEMYQLSSSPDEFVIKQRGRRHNLQPLCLSFTDRSDSGT